MRFSHPDSSAPQSRWKGKARELAPRDEGDGGTGGVVLSLQLISDSDYQADYVVPVSLGTGESQFYLQVDTGSSDLWATSTACTSSLCSQSPKYNPSNAQSTGADITLEYAEGQAGGPVFWDVVHLGGYEIDNQALIAASSVDDEPLSSSFNGVLGLAPPANSLISQQIPPTTSNAPDGATLVSNLFSISPLTTAPGARFLSLALERPGSATVPSVLGIGRHPSELVSDPSKIEYDTIIATTTRGPSWWQVTVRAINIYVDGVKKPVSLPPSSSGAAYPSAILDSGVPVIVTSTTIANGIYGALGVSPADDGSYYLPCTMPINMTIQLDDRTEIPLHPLDLSYYPPNNAGSDTCIGSIQTPAQIPGLVLSVADMILGVPFLRNTYTVMAYDPPFANGSFPTNTENVDDPDYIRLRLGLLNLTNPAVAADEFHQVRVLKQPLGNAASGATTGPTHSKGLSVGIEVLIALLGFFGLCFVLFGARWAYQKRKYARERAAAAALDGKDGAYVVNELGYHLAALGTRPSGPSEDELRQRRYEAYKLRQQLHSTYTDDSGSTRTRVASFVDNKGVGAADEFGSLKTPVPDTPGTPTRGYFDPWDDTLVDNRPPTRLESGELLLPPRSALLSDSPTRSMHRRTLSGGPTPDTPLLGHGHSHSRSDSNPQGRDSEDITERRASMAGVGTASRSRRLHSPLATSRDEYAPRLSHESRASASPPRSPLPLSFPPVALVPAPEPMFSASRNESGVSNLGHDS